MIIIINWPCLFFLASGKTLVNDCIYFLPGSVKIINSSCERMCLIKRYILYTLHFTIKQAGGRLLKVQIGPKYLCDFLNNTLFAI